MVLTRLRIGHTRFTHSYQLKREDQPLCISCNEPFTVKHFLIDRIEFSHVRRQFFQTNGLRYLFEDVPTDNILMFKKKTPIFLTKYNITALIFKFVLVLHFMHI